MRYYATLGPACTDVTTLSALFSAGVTGFRLNLSHAQLMDYVDTALLLRQIAAGRDYELLIDLQGPDLRIGKLDNPLAIAKGDLVLLGEGGVPCPQVLLEALRPGQRLILDDGKIELKVASLAPVGAFCVAQRSGVLESSKGIFTPGLDLNLPGLTQNDLVSLSQAAELGVTGVMLPFVRNRSDLETLRDIMVDLNCSQLKVFAKVECLSGVENLTDYLDLVDEVIIARGDLANEIPLWKIPQLQKSIGEVCISHGVPFMVVTQLLDSMCRQPQPTRAEVSDIYNAVLDGASSLMLTQETAVGLYPVQAATYLVRTAQTALDSMNLSGADSDCAE